MPPKVKPRTSEKPRQKRFVSARAVVGRDGRGPEALAGALRLRFAEPGQAEGEHENADRGEREVDRPPGRDSEMSAPRLGAITGATPLPARSPR